MVDGRGRARITDFGLAVAASEVQEGEVSGTPAYMAPEQLAGKGASIRSDIYALGLVLYELSTGKKAFDAASLDELRRKHTEETPTAPSTVAPGFDPVVERVILRCLEKDPAQRPSSVAQVAAALPGRRSSGRRHGRRRNPLPRNGRRRGRAGSPLAGHGAAPPARSRRGARARDRVFAAREHRERSSASTSRRRSCASARARSCWTPDWRSPWIGRTGSTRTIAFSTGLAYHGGLAGDLSRDAVGFVYRQASIVPGSGAGDHRSLSFADRGFRQSRPPRARNGRSPGRSEGKAGSARGGSSRPSRRNGRSTRPTDWSPAVSRSRARHGPIHPASSRRWSPRGYATERAAWEGPHPERPGVTMRVEAASYDGRPVSFFWLGPWVRPRRGTSESLASANGELVFEGILFLCILVGAILVRHNLRSGRSDRRGALRLAAAIGGLTLIMWILGGHHVRNSDEGWLFLEAFSNAAGTGLIYWILYAALEPFARRRWPEMLISWQRALSGRWRDPLVGRDALIGAVVGTVAGLHRRAGARAAADEARPSGGPRRVFTVTASVTVGSAAGVAHRHRGDFRFLGPGDRLLSGPRAPAGPDRMARRPNRDADLLGPCISRRAAATTWSCRWR